MGLSGFKCGRFKKKFLEMIHKSVLLMKRILLIVQQPTFTYEYGTITTCSEYGFDEFFGNPVNYAFLEASCYVESTTVFK